MKTGTVWKFETRRFTVALEVTEDHGYRYDGDDPDGEVQAKLDAGDYVAFDSDVIVYLDGEEIARDSLGGSVYDPATMHEFWTGHRDPDPMNRNCTVGRAMRGGSVVGHYFPDMVATAISEARQFLNKAPRMRRAA